MIYIYIWYGIYGIWYKKRRILQKQKLGPIRLLGQRARLTAAQAKKSSTIKITAWASASRDRTGLVRFWVSGGSSRRACSRQKQKPSGSILALPVFTCLFVFGGAGPGEPWKTHEAQATAASTSWQPSLLFPFWHHASGMGAVKLACRFMKS